VTTRAILIATNRSGSTFLNYALDSHPDIGWERGEPLAHLHPDADPSACVDRLLAEKRGYEVVGCKLSYRFIRDRLSLAQLPDISITKLIHLYRADAVRTTLSATINSMARDGLIDRVYHTMQPLPPVQITVDADEFVSECLRYVGNVRDMKQALMGQELPVLTLTYEGMMGGRDRDATQIDAIAANAVCDFLGVSFAPLTAHWRRLNPQPIEEIVTNWGDLQRVLVSYAGDLTV